MKGSFLSKLDSNVRKLSKGHKKIASYIKANYDKAAFMTASALGRKVGVSESKMCIRDSLEIPRDKLVVFTGLSGSGKSSLAFDTIYAEGQRRYVESLSSYAVSYTHLDVYKRQMKPFTGS